jgi:bleomycin hydrolase
VPAAAYTGLKAGQKFHDHGPMYREMREYLQSLKAGNAWSEKAALETIRAILDHHIGRPPESVTVDGQTMTPQEYLRTVTKLQLDDYVSFLSFVEKPYGEKAEYEVPDNWWHSAEYQNVYLDEYMRILKNAISRGYSLALGGDTSEPGYEGHAGIGIVPTFDIPPEAIDEYARQFRFSNGTSTDDHGIHLVGYKQLDGVDWYLIKDSGSGSRNNSHPGYYFYREDYVKLKILDFLVHKDAVEGR